MTSKTLPYNSDLARQVKATSLEPVQQRTPRKFATACDFRQQVMKKHPRMSNFHSLAEYLHAGLLEGDADVITYTPQPFCLRIGRRLYTPDCYVLRRGQRPHILELKPQKEIEAAKDADLWLVMEAFFEREGMQFCVISNESVYDREIEAYNWLEIVRRLHLADDLMTQVEEDRLLELLLTEGPQPLSRCVGQGDRETSYVREVALLRLLHKVRIEASLKTSRLNWGMEVRLCKSDGKNA